MEELVNLWKEKGNKINGSKAIRFFCNILEKHPNLLLADENQKLIQKLLVFLSTGFLLDTATFLGETRKDHDTIFAGWLAGMYFFVEHLDHTKMNPFDLNDHGFLLELRHLLEGDKRSLVKFCRKRTPCSCLDEMHAELKGQSKTGPCYHCS